MRRVGRAEEVSRGLETVQTSCYPGASHPVAVASVALLVSPILSLVAQ